jgi:hypothetical protein
MKTLDQLKDYYSTVLWSELSILESQRKQVLNKIIIAVSIIIPIIAALIILTRAIPFFVILGIICVVGAIQFISRKYRQDFKGSIITKIIKAVDENLAYSPNNCISQGQFCESGIFFTTPNRYHGDDYVSGLVGKTQIRFSEVHAAHESGSGKNRRRTPIFDGLFFIADFNKEFKSRIVVLPDVAEKFFGNIGTMLQSWNKMRGDLIKLEDPEFEKMFAVYGKDQIEARYVLSTSLVKRITDFKKKTNRNLHISFCHSNVYVAISYRRSLFEPRIFKTLLDFAPIQEYYEDVALAVGIVEDLNLNTRIWSKQ